MRTMIRIIAVAALLFAAAGAFAQNGDTLNIGGHVPLTLELTVTADANADSLTLFSAGLTAEDANIATIVIATNNTNGWELWVFSENTNGSNAGMTNADGDRIPYRISYDGSEGVTEAEIDTSSGRLVGQSALVPVLTDTGTLSIQYDSNSYNAGYYSDQLAIVLRAK